MELIPSCKKEWSLVDILYRIQYDERSRLRLELGYHFASTGVYQSWVPVKSDQSR
jgi:hypothetical protein